MSLLSLLLIGYVLMTCTLTIVLYCAGSAAGRGDQIMSSSVPTRKRPLVRIPAPQPEAEPITMPQPITHSV